MNKLGFQIGLIFSALSFVIIVVGGILGSVEFSTILLRVLLISLPMFLSGFLIDFLIQYFGIKASMLEKSDKEIQDEEPSTTDLDNKEMDLESIFENSNIQQNNQAQYLKSKLNKSNMIDVTVGEKQDFTFEPEKTANVIKQLLQQED